jgi:serine/threonine protein kinase
LPFSSSFLGVLDHPHIVKLHGVTAGSVESAVASGKECGFFIVVDKLVDTLEQRIARWHEEEKAQEGNHFIRLLSTYRQKKQAVLYARLKIALDIADALAYMHSKGIIFRDLKPDNIGFDDNDVLKLFDFGLAKELKPGQKKPDGKYELTGNTGSRRYMANEVARGLNYDQSVDVFSFGVLLWEMCTTEKPYQGYSSGKHMNLVVLGGERPKMDGSHTMYWPSGLHQLIKSCWSADCHKRPSFAEVKVLLNDIMDELCGLSSSSSPVSSPTQGSGRLMVPSPPPGAFSLLAPLSPLRKSRGKTTGGSLSTEGLSKEVKSIKPLSKVSGVRSRSWGFGPK